MSGSSNFLVFDENALSMKSDADYSADGTRINGVSAGMASVELHNKLYRQASVMVAALAQWMADQGQVVSDSDLAALTTVVANTIAKKSEFAAHLAEIVTEAAANKILKLDANAKLPASITGDAPTVGGRAPGVANGVATLDVGGNVPANQLGNAEMRYESGEWTDTTTSIDVGSTYTKNITLGFNAKIAIIKVANTTGGERGIIFANGSNSTRTYGLTGPTSTSQYTYGYLKSIDSRITRDGSFGTNIYISDAYITGNVLTIKLTNNGGVPNPMKISAYYEVIG